MSLNDDFAKFKRNLVRNVERAAIVAEMEAHALVAQKTGSLDRSLKTDQPRLEGNLAKCAFGSEGVPYAVFVHEGVKGKVYNYRRGTPPNREIVYSGVGQKFLDRAILNREGQILSIIRSTTIK